MAQNQYDLYELAEKHMDNKGVSLLMMSISEAKDEISNARNKLEAGIKTADYVMFAPSARVPSNQDDLVLQAAKLSGAFSQLSNNLYDLAILLESLGEQINY